MTSSPGLLAAVPDAEVVEILEPGSDRTPALALVEALHERAEHNPAHVYLAQLAAGSRPTMRAALETIVAIASGGDGTVGTFPGPSCGTRTSKRSGRRSPSATRQPP